LFYKPKHIETVELVDKKTYQTYKEQCLELFFDSRILCQLDSIREYFGKPIIINNWSWKGNFQFRGFRPFDCTVGSKYSQHKFGRAVDFDIEGFSAEEIRNQIIKNQHKEDFKYISRMEDNVSWVHIDCANTNKNGIYLFNV
jgi:hypothetical protein